MNEAKIFKFSGYAVDSIDPYSKDQVKDSLYDWADDQSFQFLQHVHVEEAVLQDDDLDDLSVNNCDLSHCEKHFQKQASAAEYDRPIPKPGEHWMHFKAGKMVEIVAVSRCSESPDSFSVIYRDPNGIVWDRPLDMFMSEVDREKYPNALTKYRFEKVVASYTAYSDTVEHYE
jgi:hypothetical protein